MGVWSYRVLLTTEGAERLSQPRRARRFAENRVTARNLSERSA